MPSFDVLEGNRGTTSDLKVRISAGSRLVQYVQAEVGAIAIGLYNTDSTFAAGGLIKTDNSGITTIALETPDYLSDIKAVVADPGANNNKFMIRQFKGNNGAIGTTGAAVFKYIPDGNYKVFVEAAKKVNGVYESIGRASTTLFVHPNGRDPGSYTDITLSDIPVTLDDNPIVDTSTTISDGTNNTPVF